MYLQNFIREISKKIKQVTLKSIHEKIRIDFKQ